MLSDNSYNLTDIGAGITIFALFCLWLAAKQKINLLGKRMPMLRRGLPITKTDRRAQKTENKAQKPINSTERVITKAKTTEIYRSPVS